MQYSLLGEEGGLAANVAVASQLQTADPRLWPVDSGWQDVKDAFFHSAEGKELLARLARELDAGTVVFPPDPLRALSLTPLCNVRVVILGQDPYHGKGQAEGLAFSVAAGVAIPPSLRNIFKELALESDATQAIFPLTHGSLVPWAQQGVLLLNTCLTVAEGKPASHAKWGWEALTESVIRTVSERTQGTVFMLWGVHAQSRRGLIDEGRHMVLCANHPSPLSATRPPVPFIGCGHFGTSARWLSAR